MAQATITTQDILRQSVERNRYFYGKLMTVRDFTQEQQYFLAKRWLINRLLFGSGVIAGLQVAKSGADPTTSIEIQPGVAFDPLGREITVLAVPGGNKFDLSKTIPAPAPPFTGDKKGFICLSLHECPKEPVPSLKSSPCDETCESNRWSEMFDLSWDEETGATPAPSLCEQWLNRTTATVEGTNFRIERTTPRWVRLSEVFEVVVRVTAKQDATNVSLTETRTGGLLIEPTSPVSPPSQFPTAPVNLKSDEFFVYVYQIQAPGAIGTFDLEVNTVGLPALKSTIEVVNEATAKQRESALTIETNSGEPAETCVRIAKLTAHFTASRLDGITDISSPGLPRFRYSLERVTEMLDCLRASLLAEPGSPRPGHALITFNDLETTDLKPIAATPAHGTAFTVTRGDHVHALLLAGGSGLEFVGAGSNELRINGDVGGDTIRFLSTVAGQTPIEAEDLVTKQYVDSRIAGLDWQESVLDKDLVDPPAEPKDGDRYLIFNEKPTGAWKGHQNDIAEFSGKAWTFTTPDEGTATFVEDENIAYLFVDGSWIPFLATPAVTAGDGLVANGASLAVGRGGGIVVNPDDVAVAFEANTPQPIGTTAAAGLADTSSRGDHVHALPLDKGSGLEFGADGLRVNGPVIGETIDFQAVVSGQTPTLDRHLVIKKYVDDKVAAIPPPLPVVPGRGLLFDPDRSLAVGEGDGVLVTDDQVSARFSVTTPRPDTDAGDVGREATVAHGDHSHPLPLVTPGSATGVVLFRPSRNRSNFHAETDSIDPGLGNGPISVQLAGVTRDGTLVFNNVTNTRAEVRLGDPTTFRIVTDAIESPFESEFTIQWFAYRPAIERKPIEVIIPDPANT